MAIDLEDEIYLGPPVREECADAAFVGVLMQDDGLRLADFGAMKLFAALRDSIQTEAHNPLAIATLLMRLAKIQSEIAESRDYPLCRAVETYRRALAHFAAALSIKHHVTLKCRYALALVLIAKGDLTEARKELQAIIDQKRRDFDDDSMPPELCALIQDHRESIENAAKLVASILGIRHCPQLSDQAKSDEHQSKYSLHAYDSALKNSASQGPAPSHSHHHTNGNNADPYLLSPNLIESIRLTQAV